ncbi:MAG: hypothetical protein QXD02_01410 [Candidatus Parvarchaeum sp.]|nr:hypothetical protein [Candidatus Parvarchaeum tengchongense]MCW1298963.1 hypothetical protein [Candidatus Parvarchaeum tengchongense]
MKNNALKLFGSEIINESAGFARLCRTGRRWGGKAILIVLDACLDSTGLNYFTVVVPKVNYFREKYVNSGRISKCEDFKDISEKELLSMFKNERVWKAMKKICSFISERDSGGNEIKTLKDWAENADPFDFKNDKLGRIKGVGISTFQYLRIQSGIDTIMPDKIIMNWISKNFKKVKTPYECILEGSRISKILKISQTELCWAIWIKESGELNRIKVE